MLEGAGCQLLVVHGRTISSKHSVHNGKYYPADWKIIGQIKLKGLKFSDTFPGKFSRFL
jgi:hypothetical protein